QEADIATRQQLVQDAIVHLKKAIDIYPAYDNAQQAIGNAYFFAGQSDTAIAHLKLAIALNPRDKNAMNNLNVVYFNTQRFAEAINTCRLLLKSEPNNMEGH